MLFQWQLLAATRSPTEGMISCGRGVGSARVTPQQHGQATAGVAHDAHKGP